MNGAIVIAIVAVVVAAALFLFVTSARRDRNSAMGLREAKRKDRSSAVVKRLGREEGRRSAEDVEREAHAEARGTELVPVSKAAPPALRAPMDEEVLAVTRRQFFNRGIVAMFGLGIAGFGTAAIGFLWPSLSGGFGSKIRAGKLEDILGSIKENRQPFYVPEGRFYINPYPKDDIAKAKNIYVGGVLAGMEEGVVALYQKCVHLGCRVPWCSASQWFECPCHGSKYNRVGEKTGGPAPRGLDRFGVSVDGGVVVVDTKQVIQGPPIGTNTTGQQAEGPHCA
ncbi:MAG: cytochrome b6-f complex iron-sulfur subunit [Acidimicrobiaceae bacterium]|nr:cytochrome b6-f complex iron-sulfur subunit [Acidimicrobiaceae bacterium]MDQ1444388.1 cytochrome b6-f complex iron-sulfur subunit [Acidimicrobiaceae bacterium]